MFSYLKFFQNEYFGKNFRTRSNWRKLFYNFREKFEIFKQYLLLNFNYFVNNCLNQIIKESALLYFTFYLIINFNLMRYLLMLTYL